MQAIVMSKFGPPAVLAPTEVGDPAAGPEQVVVSVEFANVTFVETQVRAGRSPFPMPAEALPLIPGNGVGGVVVEVGSRLPREWLGRRVVSGTGGSGGYAERVVLDVAGLIEVPEQLSMDDAVALLADGRTAIALVAAARVDAADRVLIEAAAGGVGSLLTQLCASVGARVVAAARGADKLQLARDLGAELAVDYSEHGWVEAIKADGPVTAVFDGVGGAIASAAFDLIAPGGRMLSYGMASGTFAALNDDVAATRGVTILRGVPVDPARATDLTRRALQEAAAGRLRPIVGQRFPLADAAVAHAAMESRRTIGKTLLVVPGPERSSRTELRG